MDKIKIKITLAYAEKHFGPRCEEYDPDCPICEGWKNYDATDGHLLYDNDQLLQELEEGWELFGMVQQLQDELDQLNPKRSN